MSADLDANGEPFQRGGLRVSKNLGNICKHDPNRYDADLGSVCQDSPGAERSSTQSTVVDVLPGSCREQERDPNHSLYWGQLGGLLVEEFCVIARGTGWGQRLVDAIVLPARETRVAGRREPIEIRAGERVVIVQTKGSRLGMYLMGQRCFQRTSCGDAIPTR